MVGYVFIAKAYVSDFDTFLKQQFNWILSTAYCKYLGFNDHEPKISFNAPKQPAALLKPA
jgi:hypothetical protein